MDNMGDNQGSGGGGGCGGSNSNENFVVPSTAAEIMESRMRGGGGNVIASSIGIQSPTTFANVNPLTASIPATSASAALFRNASVETAVTIEDNLPTSPQPTAQQIAQVAQIQPQPQAQMENVVFVDLVAESSSSRLSQPGSSSRDLAPSSARKRKASVSVDELNMNTDSIDPSQVNNHKSDKLESPTPEKGADPQKSNRIDRYFKKSGGNTKEGVVQSSCSTSAPLSTPAVATTSSFSATITSPAAPAPAPAPVPASSSTVTTAIPSIPASSAPIPHTIDLSSESKSPFVVITSGGSSKSRGANAATQKEQQDMKKQLETFRLAKEQAELKTQRLEAELKSANEKSKCLEDRCSKLQKSLEDVYRKMAQQEFKRVRDRLALDNVRLGKVAFHRTGPTQYNDTWEDGYIWKDINRRNAELLTRKEELESRKKKMASVKRAVTKKSNAAGSTEEGGGSNGAVDNADYDMELDVLTEAESLRAHVEQLKRDESALAEERRLLETEKAIHIKELKRTQCEERSRFFRDLPCFNGRYLLQSLLGRGGFSEVWKAFDLQEIRDVAVKIHQLNPAWSEERKASYIRHVTREYNIHREMKHARVVQLFDVFEIDLNSFATVLEYCRGIDLDEKLKRQKILPEKDARAILLQILCGLRYLHRPLNYSGLFIDHPSGSTGQNNEAGGDAQQQAINKRRSIIHYDLKPANILFDEMGDVKITDFGLAKIIDDNEGTSMELTSQGAGTYWYLPPECFDKGPNPRISSKVDVWSAGVIFYQMLYGTRPFGEGKTQENVWAENIIYNASHVNFPNDAKAPKVSEEAKELIRQCLTKDQHTRPDIDAIWQNPYLRK